MSRILFCAAQEHASRTTVLQHLMLLTLLHCVQAGCHAQRHVKLHNSSDMSNQGQTCLEALWCEHFSWCQEIASCSIYQDV